jgi:hypothetical protein
MTLISERREKWFNRTLADWMADIIHEAGRDMVSAEQIVGGLKDDFGFAGEELLLAEKLVLENLFRSGATIAEAQGDPLVLPTDATASPESFADFVISRVSNDPEAATLAGLWFKR